MSIAAPADGVELDRAQRPVLTVPATDAVTVTLDGAAVPVGEPLDLTGLAAGAHRLRAEVIGPRGTATAEATFTVAVTPAGLGHLVLTSGVKDSALTVLTEHLVKGRYAKLARYVDQHAGRFLPEAKARVIAADARTLANR
ncbi:hypothetical protein MCAG_04865 [Micromonospora sp. ATCC 39149]|nr:hypothetical protein MCAG_04865 [Micromonospora sp. ATCC 39149]